MEKPRKGLKEGRIPTYEDSLKIAGAKDYLEGNLSYRQVGLKYNLSGDTIRYFVRWYQEVFSVVPIPDAGLSSSESKEHLAEELALVRLKLTAMEMMIKNYEKETGVDIIKKSGTKQPAK